MSLTQQARLDIYDKQEASLECLTNGKQLKEQLAALDVQEEDLLDVLGDPDVPNAKINARPSPIKQERERLTGQITSVEFDLAAGKDYI